MEISGLSSLAIKLIGGALALLLIIGAFTYLIHDRNHWKAKAESYNTEAVADWQATALAAGNPKLERKDTATQIGLLGSSLKTTTDALNVQNAAVDALAKQSAEEQRQAAQASQEAAGRADEAEAAAARLIASSRSAPATGACVPSKTLQEQWQ